MAVKDSVIKFLNKKRVAFFQDDNGNVYGWGYDDTHLNICKIGRKRTMKFDFNKCEFWLEGGGFYIKKDNVEYNFVLMAYADRHCYVGKFPFI